MLTPTRELMCVGILNRKAFRLSARALEFQKPEIRKIMWFVSDPQRVQILMGFRYTKGFLWMRANQVCARICGFK